MRLFAENLRLILNIHSVLSLYLMFRCCGNSLFFRLFLAYSVSVEALACDIQLLNYNSWLMGPFYSNQLATYNKTLQQLSNFTVGNNVCTQWHNVLLLSSCACLMPVLDSFCSDRMLHMLFISYTSILVYTSWNHIKLGFRAAPRNELK